MSIGSSPIAVIKKFLKNFLYMYNIFFFFFVKNFCCYQLKLIFIKIFESVFNGYLDIILKRRNDRNDIKK